MLDKLVEADSSKQDVRIINEEGESQQCTRHSTQISIIFAMLLALMYNLHISKKK